VDTRSWPCPPCGEVRDFVQPPCADGHTDDGGDCPEWICVDCGTALLIGDTGTASAAVWARVAA
jgi:hypothetical protein